MRHSLIGDYADLAHALQLELEAKDASHRHVDAVGIDEADQSHLLAEDKAGNDVHNRTVDEHALQAHENGLVRATVRECL